MKLYFEAEKFMKDGETGLKTRIFNAKTDNSPKHIYALVISALKFKKYTQHIIKKAKLSSSADLKRLKVTPHLLSLLVYDYVFSPKGRIQLGKHPIKDAFLSHKTRISAEFIKLKMAYKVKSASELPLDESIGGDETPVRWFRVNAIKILVDEFFGKHSFFANLKSVDDFRDLTQPGLIFKDGYIHNLYGVHPREKITSHTAYMNGELIIQDRASCFPGEILFNDASDVHMEVIDATAAPGNKTTHVASFLKTSSITNRQEQKNPVVYAFERDAKRVKVLRLMCDKATGAGAKSLIHPTHADFTSISPVDFPSVSGIIVDPSCSGSGIFGRAVEDCSSQEQAREEFDTLRLQKLASFQFSIVKHALLFPNARKVVYSTCLIHPHENERVVVDLLQDAEIQKQGWRLAPREVVIPEWPRRGWEQEFTALGTSDDHCKQLAGGCVRSVPKEDGGIGFFAACFVRDI